MKKEKGKFWLWVARGGKNSFLITCILAIGASIGIMIVGLSTNGLNTNYNEYLMCLFCLTFFLLGLYVVVASVLISIAGRKVRKADYRSIVIERDAAGYVNRFGEFLYRQTPYNYFDFGLESLHFEEGMDIIGKEVKFDWEFVFDNVRVVLPIVICFFFSKEFCVADIQNVTVDNNRYFKDYVEKQFKASATAQEKKIKSLLTDFIGKKNGLSSLIEATDTVSNTFIECFDSDLSNLDMAIFKIVEGIKVLEIVED